MTTYAKYTAQAAGGGAPTIGEGVAKPQVSVIIPVYKAARTLRPCLDSVFASKGVIFEVIVVNDCSPDESEAIAREYPCKIVSLKKNIMASSCRNLGVRHASADILVFFDADQVMRPDTLARFLEALRHHPEASAIVASFTADTPMPGYFSKFKNLRHHHVHQRGEGRGATLCSGLTAIHRSIFEQMNGFEQSYQPSSIEDIALGYKMTRAGHTILFRGNIEVQHLKGYTLGQLIVSDIRDRAVPWVGLMLRDRIWQNRLNTSCGNVFSVILACMMPLALLLAAHWGWRALCAPGVCLLLIWLLNARLLRACYSNFGLRFLGKSLLFTPCMYAYMGIGFAAGLIAHFRHNLVALHRNPVEANYEVYDLESEHATV